MEGFKSTLREQQVEFRGEFEKLAREVGLTEHAATAPNVEAVRTFFNAVIDAALAAASDVKLTQDQFQEFALSVMSVTGAINAVLVQKATPEVIASYQEHVLEQQRRLRAETTARLLERIGKEFGKNVQVINAADLEDKQPKKPDPRDLN